MLLKPFSHQELQLHRQRVSTRTKTCEDARRAAQKKRELAEEIEEERSEYIRAEKRAQEKKDHTGQSTETVQPNVLHPSSSTTKNPLKRTASQAMAGYLPTAPLPNDQALPFESDENDFEDDAD